MTLPSQVANNSQNPQQNQQSLISDQSQSQTQQATQQDLINPQAGQQSNNSTPDINAQIFGALQSLNNEISGLKQQNQMLQFQLQTSNRGGFPAAQQTPQIPQFTPPDKDKYWEDPAQATTQVVEHLMNKSLAPLAQRLDMMFNQQQYANAKQQMKNLPQFKFLAQFEDIFDSIINQALAAGNALSDGLLITAYNAALGIALNSGRLQLQNGGMQVVQQQNANQQFGQQQSNPFVIGGNQQQQQLQQGLQQNQFPQNQQFQQQQPNNLVTPPYLNTNGSSANVPASGFKFRTLDENEEILRKKNGMTQGEFLYYGDEINLDTLKALDPVGWSRVTKTPLNQNQSGGAK